MDDEQLEWALRRLPGVLACSLEGDTVTLLLDPHASAIDIEAGANALLFQAGDSRPPLVLGGTRPVVAGRRRFDVVPVVKAAGPGVLAVGAAALVASLVTSPAAFWRDAPVASPPEAGTAITVTVPADGPIRSSGRTARTPLPADELGSAPEVAVAPDRRLVLLVPELPAAPGTEVATAAPIPAAPAVELAASVGKPRRSLAHTNRTRVKTPTVPVLVPTVTPTAAPVPQPDPVEPVKPAKAPEAPVPPPVSPTDSVPTIPKHRDRGAKPRPANVERKDRKLGLELAEKVVRVRVASRDSADCDR